MESKATRIGVIIGFTAYLNTPAINPREITVFMRLASDQY